MTTFKVWIHVEEIDEEADECGDITEPIDVLETDDEEKALEMSYYLENAARTLVKENPAAVSWTERMGLRQALQEGGE